MHSIGRWKIFQVSRLAKSSQKQLFSMKIYGSAGIAILVSWIAGPSMPHRRRSEGGRDIINRYTYRPRLTYS